MAPPMGIIEVMTKTGIKLEEGQKLKVSHYRTVVFNPSATKLTSLVIPSLPHPKWFDGKFRKHELDGILKHPNVELGNFGGKTVATIVDKDGVTIAAGVALCSDEDRFSKGIGNSIALGRLQTMLDCVNSGNFCGGDVVEIAHNRASNIPCKSKCESPCKSPCQGVFDFYDEVACSKSCNSSDCY